MKDQIRQSIIFGNPLPGQNELVSRFCEFTKSAKFNISDDAMQRDLPFITRRLNYEVALAAFGPEAAKKMQITADKEIQSAIEALPRAAMLAETAHKARTSTDNKKTRRVAYPTGQGRNRRN
jgi:hypothetical protein